MNQGHVYVYYCAWIKPPHDKICLCICHTRHWVFWFNSRAAFHGIAQLPIVPADHPAAITDNCFLDLSGLKALDDREIALANAAPRGQISLAFRAKLLTALANPIKTLPESQRLLAIAGIK
jgi:hypothetical protein